MIYVVFMVPGLMSQIGMDHGAAFTATCLAAGLGSLIMGLFANYPLVVAPGIGATGFFTAVVVGAMEYGWQSALGAVFVAGLLFFVLSLLKIRDWTVLAVPNSLKAAIAAGIGFQLAVFGLRSVGILADDPTLLTGLGDPTSVPALLTLFGFFALVMLYAFGVPGAAAMVIFGLAGLGVVIGLTPLGDIFALPANPLPGMFAMNLSGAFDLGLLGAILAFLLRDIFDTSGTLLAVSRRTELAGEQGRLPRVGRVLVADSIATMLGALLGTPGAGTHPESAAGIATGGRTGLTALAAGLLFLACLFLEPLAATVQAYATAPVLLFVAFWLARPLGDIDWEDLSEYAPAALTTIAIPLTNSITDGIGFGFIAYTGIKALTGRTGELYPAVLALTGIFAVMFWMA